MLAQSFAFDLGIALRMIRHQGLPHCVAGLVGAEPVLHSDALARTGYGPGAELSAPLVCSPESCIVD
jgi:hypothetical protein